MAPSADAAYGTIFLPADVERLAAASDLALAPGADATQIAAHLESAAGGCLLSSSALAAATPGECAAWAREVERRALALLECFDHAEDWSDPVGAARQVLRGPSGFIEVPGLPLDPRAELQAAIASAQALARRASLAAVEYEVRKGAPRQAPELELAFFRALGDVYLEAFGSDWAVATSAGKARGGGGVRFCRAVGEHLERWIAEAELRDDTAIRSVVRRLKSPTSSAERIRDLRSGGPVRKR